LSAGTGARRPRQAPASDFPRDLLAGLTVGASQVGNAMAYTILAGVPPVHGLYATMVGTPVGALTSGSQRMAIVPTAALCLAAGGALAGLPADQRVAGLFVLTLMTGVIMLAAGLLRAGSLLRFISNAVIVGFMLGVSVQIILGQLLALTGFSSSYSNKVAKVVDMLAHAGALDVATTLVGVATIALILVLSTTRLKLFAMAAALVVVTVAVAVLGLSSVPVVGDIASIPDHFPLPQLPDLSLAPRLLLPALALAIIGLVQGAGIGRTVPNTDGTLGDPSRDFVAQGAANVASGIFGGATVGGSVQATALNVRAGSRTRWSAFLAGVVVIVVVLAAAPLVQQVPQAVTAGILIVAAASAIKPRSAGTIWHADRLSAAVMVVTFVLVLVIPLQYAVLAGAAISVLLYVYQSSLDVRVVEVTIAADGRSRESEAPRALPDASVTVLDIYGSLFFAADPKLRESLPAVGGARCAVVVLRLRGRGTLHSTTLTLIRGYADELAAGSGRLYLAGVGTEMEGQLRRTGLLDVLGDDAVLPATDELYGSCAEALRLGRAWLESRPAPATQPRGEHETRPGA
jgi:SulP family sulfate permease